MSDIDDTRKLIAAFRTQPGMGLIAYTIEAGLDEALKIPLGADEALMAISPADRDALVAALLVAMMPGDGRDPQWNTWNDLLGRLHSLEFPSPLTDPSTES